MNNGNLIHLLLIKLLFGQFACGQILFSLPELLVYTESWWNEFRQWLFCFINWTVNADFIFIVVQNSNLKPADVNKADW